MKLSRPTVILAMILCCALHTAIKPADANEPLAFEIDAGEALFGSTDYRPGPFVVHLNCGEGIGTGEMLKHGNLVVQGLDTDAGKVTKARQNPAFRKDYGSRISFRQFDGEHLPFVNNSVNNILSTEAVKVLPREIHRALVPGGIAVFRSDVAPVIGKDLADITLIKSGQYQGFYRLEKKWPSEIDEWTHHMHGPDNNRVANDRRIAPPLSHLQWTAGPRYTRHHEHMSSFQAMVSARGKVFYIMDEGKKDSVLLPPEWNLVARDGFNGIVLWRKNIKNWVNHLWAFKSGPTTVTRRMVVQGDRLFVTLSITGGVSILDANSGDVLHTFPNTAGAEELIVDGDRLFVVKRKLLSEASKFQMQRQQRRTGAPSARPSIFNWTKETAGQSVMAFDTHTRKLLWERPTPIAPFGVGARDGNVFVFDGEKVASLKGDSGNVNWQSVAVGALKVYAPNSGSNLVCSKTRIMLGSASGNMVALSTKDGSVVWKGPQYASGRHSPKDLFLINDVAWTAATLGASMTLPGVPSTARRKSGRITGFKLSDGTVVSDFYTESDAYIMNSRCHMSCATADYFITSRTGAELVSVKEEKWNLHHWLRGACLFGLMPANGMLYAPPNPCACYTQSSLDGFNAVTGHNPDWPEIVKNHKSHDFVRGTASPTKQKNRSGEVDANSWPVYRHDNKRSGSTVGKVALPLTTNWRIAGYENLTAPVVASGCCIFAEKDRHTVHCLDAQNGEKKWSYVAGGRIDSPPTVSGSSIFFGSGDGWLYQLSLSSGELVWKRRIAQADLFMFDHGQPTSVWPLSGSVLVQDGKVYCVSGRSAFLDGGMRLTLVDAVTGKILEANVINDRDPNNGKDMHQHVAMQNMPVALPDLLSSDGKHLYMLTQQFDLRGKRTHIKNSAWDDDIKIGVGRDHIFSATGFLDDNWFHRSYWVYGNCFLEGCSVPDGGWFEMGRISPSGKMLCFDDNVVYGYGQFPEYSKWNTPLRYSLFAVNKKPKSYQPGKSDEELRKSARMNWRTFRSLRRPKVEFDFQWKSGVPLRAKAIVKTQDTLFLAGPEDVVDEEKAFNAIGEEATKKLLQQQSEVLASANGGKLLAVSVVNGAVVQMIDLESGPVWDGMAAAYGKLFICCKDGSVVALANDGTNKADGS